MHSDIAQVLISAEQIHERIRELGGEAAVSAQGGAAQTAAPSAAAAGSGPGTPLLTGAEPAASA